MGADEEGTHERVKAHAGLCVTPRRHDWLADGNRVTKVISVASLSKCHGAPGPGLAGRSPAMLSCGGSWWWASSTPSSPGPRVDEVLALELFERRAPILGERRVLLDAGRQRTAAWVRANDNYVEWVRPRTATRSSLLSISSI